jgi:hypothetical protein
MSAGVVLVSAITDRLRPRKRADLRAGRGRCFSVGLRLSITGECRRQLALRSGADLPKAISGAALWCRAPQRRPSRPARVAGSASVQFDRGRQRATLFNIAGGACAKRQDNHYDAGNFEKCLTTWVVDSSHGETGAWSSPRPVTPASSDGSAHPPLL